MKKNIGMMKIAVTFAGSVLGAGYVSGRELWLYFGSYGKNGLIGVFISILLLSLLSAAVLRVAAVTGECSCDRIIIFPEWPRVRKAMGVLFLLIYFSVTVIMLAGIGSLAKQLLGLPEALGAALAAAVVFGFAVFGLGGMTAVFSVSIPVLVAAAVLICLIRLFRTGLPQLEAAAAPANPLLGNFLNSAVNYAVMNYLASLGVLAPLAPGLKNRRSISGGITLGALALLMVAVSLILAVGTSPESAKAALPMLDLAGRMGSIFALLYGILLFLGMLGNGIGTMVAITDFLEKKSPFCAAHRIPCLAACILLAYLLSLCGFSDLVGTVYPALGYIGLATAFFLLLHLLKLKNRSGRF